MDRLKTLPEPSATLEADIRTAIADLRPILQRDGGDVELVAVEGDIVVVDMKGACSGCVLASVTIAGLRKRLIEAVGRPLKVVPRSAMALIKRSVAA
jgi:Fe-S cluster biogenesis protein NfuA